MLKTLKAKLSLIYITLILGIAFLGIVSVNNLSIISDDIGGLLSNNYESIQAVEEMKDAVSNQENAILLYLSESDSNALENYAKNNSLFLDSFHFEKNNITEDGEKEAVSTLEDLYSTYSKNFYILTDIFHNKGKDDAITFFNENIQTIYVDILKELTKINNLNETIMIDSKNRVRYKTELITQMTILLTIVSILVFFIWSKHLLRKILMPLNNIIDAIKCIKTNSSYKKLEITTEDEFGELINQFNLMTKRIKDFEKSSLGKITKERNNANSILRSINSPIVVIDKDYKITMANNEFIKAFNINEHIIEGKYLTHLVKDKEFFSIVYNITLNDCQSDLTNILSLKNEESNTSYYNVSVRVIIDDNIDVGYVILLKDVTHLKEIEQVSKDFFTTISHEFKTPLTSIMIGTGLLGSSKIGELNVEQTNIINTIKEDGERLNTLVSNMLTLSKIESSKEIYNKDYNSVANLINTAVSTNKEIADYHGIILEYNVESNVELLLCDGEKFVWVLNNLITNAIKHCENGDLISIRAFSNNNNLTITVTDTGVGILKEHNKLIFERYTKLNNKEIKNSSGLGLWICKDIITAHNGEISCESDLGEGATFKIIIPYN